jgi:hypothetical protein
LTELEGGCIEYEIEVSFEGVCSPALSHYSLGLGCGIVSDASNSANWPMSLNTVDPTTGLGGLKVDEIQEFGDESSLESFIVNFTFCPSGCGDVNCISPAIAYKAGTCVFRDTIDANCIKPLEVTAQGSELSCANDQDGEAYLSISGGETPYNITWSNGESDSIITQLSKGIYTYHVISADSQEIEGTVEITAPEAINISETIVNPYCNISSNGAINADVTGGVAPYEYSWNTGDSTNAIADLNEGTYILSVMDANGCTASKSFTLSNTFNLNIVEEISQPGCSGNGGSISVSVAGGSAPYSYLWSNGSTASEITDLASGQYEVTVTDSAGCYVSETYTLSANNTLSARAYGSYTNCNNDSIAEVRLYVDGGTAPFTYSWNTGDTTQNLQNIPEGTYSVTVTDASGCTASASTYVRQRSPYIVGSTDPVVCNNPGSITTRIYYAQEPISYVWNTGDTTQNIDSLSAGTYTLDITDASGCTASRTFVIDEQESFSVNIQESSTGCGDSINYSLSATANGGTSPYTYLWNTGDSTQLIDNLEEETYTVLVTDANGCSAEQTYNLTIEEPEQISCSIVADSATFDCNSTNNFLYTTYTGDVVSYEWTVSSQDTTWTITSATNGEGVYFTAGSDSSMATFTLIITNANGCTSSCSYQTQACVPNNDDDSSDDDSDDSNSDDDSDDSDDNGGDDSDDNSDDDGSGDDSGDDDGDSDSEDGDDSEDDNDEDDGDSDSEDGDADDEEDDGNNGGSDEDNECTDCFTTIITEASVDNEIYNYNFTVDIDEVCSFDLSHLTLQLPECMTLTNYSNSEGWKMEYVKNDPTTGLTGIKIDDIPNFKEAGDQFEFSISFTSDGSCNINCWSPLVAYKAAQCVITEQVEEECLATQRSSIGGIDIYPNPASEYIYIDTSLLDKETVYSVSLYDGAGNLITTLAKGDSNDLRQPLALPINSVTTGTYFIHISSTNAEPMVHRLMIKN